jgi:hypothetical protein
MKLSDQYFQYMITGNTDAAYHMERQYGLDGYPPEMVSVIFNAMDKGENTDDAIERYTTECNS